MNQEYLKISNFEKKDANDTEKETGQKPREIVIINSHSGRDTSLIPGYEDLAEIIGEENLQKYIQLEADNGVKDLGEAIAQKVVELSQFNVRVRVINVLYPRALLDANRTIETAGLRAILPESYLEKYANELREIHNSTIDQIREILDALPEGSIVIDLHSMLCQNTKASCPEPNAKTADSETEGGETTSTLKDQVEEFLKSKLDPNNIATWRYITLIFSNMLNGTKVAHGSPKLHTELKKALTEAGLPFSENTPYHYIPGIMAAEWAEICKNKSLHFMILDFAAWTLSNLVNLEDLKTLEDGAAIQAYLDEKLRNHLETNLQIPISAENLEKIAKVFFEVFESVF